MIHFPLFSLPVPKKYEKTEITFGQHIQRVFLLKLILKILFQVQI